MRPVLSLSFFDLSTGRVPPLGSSKPYPKTLNRLRIGEIAKKHCSMVLKESEKPLRNSSLQRICCTRQLKSLLMNLLITPALTNYEVRLPSRMSSSVTQKISLSSKAFISSFLLVIKLPWYATQVT